MILAVPGAFIFSAIYLTEYNFLEESALRVEYNIASYSELVSGNASLKRAFLCSDIACSYIVARSVTVILYMCSSIIS